MNRKQIIINTVTDLAANFLYYDRKEDSQLNVKQLDVAIKKGEITTDEIVAEFKRVIENTYPK